MGLGDWLKRRFGSSGGSTEMVPFFDVESGRVVQIPASELRPGAVQARVQGIEGLVWLLPDQLRQGDVKHPPLDEGIRPVHPTDPGDIRRTSCSVFRGVGGRVPPRREPET